MVDVVIIGAGPAGITAAIYALRAGLKTTICEKNIYGGQTSIIEYIENYPVFKKISGADFSTSLYEQVIALGANFVFSDVVDLDLNSDEKCIYTSSGEKIRTKAVIIANGLKRRSLGCEGEKEFNGKGVSYCATCDGAFFKDKSVMIVGGGNTAIEDALYLSNICKEVKIIIRKDKPRAEKILIDSAKKKENIEFIFKSNITKICGGEAVESVVINKDGQESQISTNAVFIAIGYEPDNKIYEGKIKMNDMGYFESDETCKTNISGVYVAGDCRVKPLRQIVTAAADGAVCGNAAAAYINLKM